MIWFGLYELLTALATALGHDCQPSASRRADHNDRGLFRGLSKVHIALSNHVIVILIYSLAKAARRIMYG